MLIVCCILAFVSISDALSLEPQSHRAVLLRKSLAILPSAAIFLPLIAFADSKRFEYQPALQGLDYGKPRTYYPDYNITADGVQYKIAKEGNGYDFIYTSTIKATILRLVL
jgi:hypothetical protein